MALRAVVRLLLVFTVLAVPLLSITSADASVQTTPVPRSQTRLAKKSLLASTLKSLQAFQDSSGGYPYPRAEVDPRATANAINALIALRNEGIEVDLDAAVAYLQQTDPVAWADGQFLTITVSELAKIVAALVAVGGDPRDVGGNDLVARLNASWDPATGVYGTYLYETPMIIMALSIAGAEVEDAALETIATTQLADGSWDAAGSTGPGDAWVTANVIQALVAIGKGDDPIVARAVDFLRTMVTENGTFMQTNGDEPDSFVSGLAVSALLAAGEDVKSGDWTNVIPGLLSFHKDDTGWFMRSHLDSSDDFAGTISSLIALAGTYLPVLPLTE